MIREMLRNTEEMLKSAYKRLFTEKTRIQIRQSLQKFKSPIYYGHNYTCNCCNKSFRKFLQKGNIKRLNAQCPYCGSLERTRVLLFFLRQETDLFNKRLKVLHIAPEACLFNLFQKLDIDYIDGDINPANATHVIDITNIQYPNNSFDLIICSHVLGHVPNEALAIRELRRVLKNDGTALIMTLINQDAPETYEDPKILSPEERLLNYGEADLCRLHGLDFAHRLEKQNFKVSSVNYAKELPGNIVETHRLGDGKRELIFKCQK